MERLGLLEQMPQVELVVLALLLTVDSLCLLLAEVVEPLELVVFLLIQEPQAVEAVELEGQAILVLALRLEAVAIQQFPVVAEGIVID